MQDEYILKVLQSVAQSITGSPNELPIDCEFTLLGLNSIDIITIISKVEKEFNIRFDSHDLILENFSSIYKIKHQVLRKKNRKSDT
ncbi:hypothetical protein CR203_23400 [Salipaludibacillus neizhouensis]|uniref:Carrier domain-containing protein n=1 Tax=Salipaludibacillus neizhouensis TaxID=885475 RepID=A0A3A9JWW1_9BACI|nr:acyl carrier protein [Salipaludibacillus neizhouensis]RKL64957.1 hypothetical protein CR203_23400 [Salipaludibacillus neizhouensis]